MWQVTKLPGELETQAQGRTSRTLPRTGIRTSLRTFLLPPLPPPSTQCCISHSQQEFYWCRCNYQLSYQKLNSATSEGQGQWCYSYWQKWVPMAFLLHISLFSKDISQRYMGCGPRPHTCAQLQRGLGKYNFWLLTWETRKLSNQRESYKVLGSRQIITIPPPNG